MLMFINLCSTPEIRKMRQQFQFLSGFYAINPSLNNLEIIRSYHKHYGHKINVSKMNVNKNTILNSGNIVKICCQIINKTRGNLVERSSIMIKSVKNLIIVS